MNNMGSITETATAFPGNTGQRPNSVTPLAEMLRLNGYSTALLRQEPRDRAVGSQPIRADGPLATRSGFDKFYGFIGGETNQWAPTLYDGMTQVETPHDPGYNFMTDMTDKAIGWMKFQKVADAGQAVLHVLRSRRHPRSASRARRSGSPSTRASSTRVGTRCARRRWRGRSSWAWCRRARSSRPKPDAIKDWDTLSADEKKLFARQMEVFAGFGEYCDHEIGRLVDAIGEVGQLDNTLIFYILGDNGASAEGGMNGCSTR